MSNHPNRPKRANAYLSPPGNIIRDTRMQAGLTGTQCAEICYMTDRNWWYIEAGKNPMRSVDWLFFLLRTHQHPEWKLVYKRGDREGSLVDLFPPAIEEPAGEEGLR